MSDPVDVLIIGAGIAGLSTGAALAGLASVLVLEAEAAAGHHASGRSAALYEEGYGPGPIQELSRASHAGLAAAGVLSPRGILLVAGPGEAAAFEADLSAMHLTAIDLAEAQALLPILNPARIDRAAHGASAQDIDTDRLLQLHIRRIRAAGGEVRTRAPVRAITRAGGLWQVEAGGAPLRARQIVNAAGAWADHVAALAGLPPLGLTPLRRSMARIPAPAGLDPSRWPLTIGAGETFYMKPDAGALIVSPAEEDPVPPQDAWAEDMVLAEGLDRYAANVTAPVTRLLASWAGLRTFAPDRLPVLGRDPLAPDFIWCAGQGGYGFQSSDGVAALMAGIVTGAAETDLARRLSPARFRQ